VMCGFLHGKPHAFLWPTKLHRKSGFGLLQLRNRCGALLPALILGSDNTIQPWRVAGDGSVHNAI
jgi:hypothetical protein